MTLYWARSPKEVYDGGKGPIVTVQHCSIVCQKHAHLVGKDDTLTEIAEHERYPWDVCAHCAAEQKET